MPRPVSRDDNCLCYVRKLLGSNVYDPALPLNPFGGTVYVGSGDGKVYALDAVTGTERWTHTTGDAVDSSPAVVGGTVYVGSNDHMLYALDAVTGTERWTYATGGAVRSSPAVVGGTVYVGSNDSTVFALDAASGAGPAD
ncbi:outer membrane protein assembly factor BamB family protein [Actinacidiphila oryziradicis]|uniref:outer membrane protein assembly factor BamB family protein n=1 Tax=Actinacidiphila oryziradicis TaxID=2571141 RepID=UPI001B805089|nr:PQQ-binding-like beta-propeller repeat protein [Actinacidiphila oryziradicis]